MIGYYGGSFNPVHIGHIKIAEFILKNKNVDEIYLTPTISHPFDKNIASFEHRMEMLKIACKGYQSIKPTDVEKFNKEEKSYTINLLNYLKEKNNDFFFIVGLDNFNDFLKWHKYEEILKNFNIVFTTRAGVEIDNSIKTKIESIVGKEIKFSNIDDFNPKGVTFLKVPDFFIASTNIRKLLMDNKNCSGIIHREVLDYIKHHNLY